jgi:5-methyltetrahydropteroyltriglutamate--homocysteine methyltransferase
VRQVSLECANSRVPMSVLRLLPDKEILVGAIDVASRTVETPDQVAATLRAAFEHVEPARVLACTNCGMAPLPRAVAEGKLKTLAAGAALLRKELSG